MNKTAAIALLLMVLDCSASCKAPNTAAPSSNPSPVPSSLRTYFSDGSWVVGDEIAPGRYTPVDDWKSMNECIWYILPIAHTGGSPSPAPAELIVDLHWGETITTYHCGGWKRLADQ